MHAQALNTRRRFRIADKIRIKDTDMSKHTMTDLLQMQSLPLDAKIIMTKARIRAWYEHYDGDVYVAFSGGKDSTVLKHIVDSMYSDVPSVFVQTGQEYPEVRRFAEKQPGVVVVRPKKSFREIVEQYGYPLISKEQSQYIYEARRTKSKVLYDLRMNGREGSGSYKISERWKPLVKAPFPVSHKCCEYLKKRPMEDYEKETGRKGMAATMTNESQLRQANWFRYGCNAFEAKRPKSAPMSFWTEQDVLEYIYTRGLEIPSVYGSVVKDPDGKYRTTRLSRTGCIACGFGVHLEDHPNRFERLKESHPNQWNYVINKLGMGRVLDFIGVSYGKDEEETR